MNILGISCDYHDAAAALLVDGEIAAAAEEERFSRTKHDPRLPERAVASCLAMADVDARDVDVVVFHEKPLVVLSRVLAARQRRGPAALAPFVREFPVLLRVNAMIRHRIEELLAALGATRTPTVAFAEHHLSHAAAAFYPSPFESAAILTVDGIGEWTSASLGEGIHHRVELLEEQRFPHSLGLVYSLATLWCGFRPNDGEYKLMGLAPYGEPGYVEPLERLLGIDGDGGLRLDARALRWWGGDLSRRRNIVRLLGEPRRADEPIEQRHADLAASAQALTDRALLAMARHAHEVTGAGRLCLAGGVALNCAATGRVLRESDFEEVWVQPAAGDAGSAVGAALWYHHGHLGNRRTVHPTATPRPDGRSNGNGDGTVRDAMRAGALGPSFGSDEIARWLDTLDLDTLDLRARRIDDLGERCRTVARRLADGAVVGWFEGRMEFGPRALGHRSILADPRSTTIHADLNRRVKGRESFRPFAPAVLWERSGEWFDLAQPSPYMSFVVPVAASRLVPVEDEPLDLAERAGIVRSQIPACTHVDGTARVQTVHADQSPAFHRLLREFDAITDCPVLLNTSFNRAGEPIVCTPDDALRSARSAGLDLLVLEDHLLELGGAA